MGAMQRHVVVKMNVGIHSDILSRPTPVSSFAMSIRPDIARATNVMSNGTARKTRGRGAGLLAQIVMMLVMTFGRRHRVRSHA